MLNSAVDEKPESCGFKKTESQLLRAQEYENITNA
jgi:hypothetical protein